jgi:hypothetical protein
LYTRITRLSSASQCSTKSATRAWRSAGNSERRNREKGFIVNPEEFRRKQREKIQQARQRQTTMEQHAAAWDSIISQMLRTMGEAAWGPAVRLRHWHGEWEVYAPIPTHPHYRVSLKLDDAGKLSHFVVKCAAGEFETEAATEVALAETLKRATKAGPAGWP